MIQCLSNENPEDAHMYIGGGILGTLLVIVLIIYIARRM